MASPLQISRVLGAIRPSGKELRYLTDVLLILVALLNEM